MDVVSIVLVAAAILVYAAISGRAERGPLSPPMFFLAVGWAGARLLDVDPGIIEGLAELTLVLVLFTDAARIDVSCLRREGSLPARMLGLGMPLTVAAGAAVALLFFSDLGWASALLLAAILTPTDAALGQAVVSDRRIPTRIRQSLNVESGLNDGIALPVVLVFASIAGAGQAGNALFWLRVAALAVVLGPLVGTVVGYVGGRLVSRGTANGWINAPFQRLAGLGLALLAYAGAELVGGNGFIAAFVAGLVLGNTARSACECLYEFGEAEGQLFALLVFLAFGATLVPEAVTNATPSVLLYAVLSLTVIRMIPVALSLLGAGLRLPTIGFLGWFGPRGLASILFVQLVVEAEGLEDAALVVTVVVITVLLSTFLHGVTAYPLATRYAGWTDGLAQHEPEHRPMIEMPPRIRSAGLP